MMDQNIIETKIEAFVQHLRVERNLSPHTQQAYKNDLSLFLQFCDQRSAQEMKNLTFKQLVERYLNSLYHQKLNKSSIARKCSCFTSFEKFLKREGISLDLHLVRPQLAIKIPTALRIDEIAYLLDTVKDQALPTRQPLRDKTIFELMYATGIRCSEIITIRLADVNLIQKTIIIKGKKKSERLVLFGNKAKEAIERYLSLERSPAYSCAEPLFLNHSNGPLTSRTIQRIISMFGLFLPGNQQLTPHILRHSFAAHLHKQGVELAIIQELLGLRSMVSAEKYTQVKLECTREICQTNASRKIIKRMRKQ